MDAVRSAARVPQALAHLTAQATKLSQDAHPSAPPRGDTLSRNLQLEQEERQGALVDTLV